LEQSVLGVTLFYAVSDFVQWRHLVFY